MFSHVTVGVTDFEKSFTFYSSLMDALDLELRFCERDKPWAGWHTGEGDRPLFIICTPFNGNAHHPGNGQMVAFSAASRDNVRHVHATALLSGAVCEGPPGVRPHYHAEYYGAYFRDPEGNKICVVSHH